MEWLPKFLTSPFTPVGNGTVTYLQRIPTKENWVCGFSHGARQPYFFLFRGYCCLCFLPCFLTLHGVKSILPYNYRFKKNVYFSSWCFIMLVFSYLKTFFHYFHWQQLKPLKAGANVVRQRWWRQALFLHDFIVPHCQQHVKLVVFRNFIGHVVLRCASLTETTSCAWSCTQRTAMRAFVDWNVHALMCACPTPCDWNMCMPTGVLRTNAANIVRMLKQLWFSHSGQIHPKKTCSDSLQFQVRDL